LLKLLLIPQKNISTDIERCMGLLTIAELLVTIIIVTDDGIAAGVGKTFSQVCHLFACPRSKMITA